jgi:hypothetical protein
MLYNFSVLVLNPDFDTSDLEISFNKNDILKQI